MELEIEKEDKIVEIYCSYGAEIITPIMGVKGIINYTDCEKELVGKDND